MWIINLVRDMSGLMVFNAKFKIFSPILSCHSSMLEKTGVMGEICSDPLMHELDHLATLIEGLNCKS